MIIVCKLLYWNKLLLLWRVLVKCIVSGLPNKDKVSLKKEVVHVRVVPFLGENFADVRELDAQNFKLLPVPRNRLQNKEFSSFHVKAEIVDGGVTQSRQHWKQREALDLQWRGEPIKLLVSDFTVHFTFQAIEINEKKIDRHFSKLQTSTDTFGGCTNTKHCQ